MSNTNHTEQTREAIADALYRKGYEDHQKGRDYDPRACDEWQRCVDAITQLVVGEVDRTDWERVARVQDAKLRAMCNEPGGFEKLKEVMDRYKATTAGQGQEQEQAQRPNVRDAESELNCAEEVLDGIVASLPEGAMQRTDFDCIGDYITAVVEALTAAPQAPALDAGVVRDACTWRQEDDGDSTYWASCGNGFSFTDGGPNDNSMKFCCYCGKHIDEQKWVAPVDEDEVAAMSAQAGKGGAA